MEALAQSVWFISANTALYCILLPTPASPAPHPVFPTPAVTYLCLILCHVLCCLCTFAFAFPSTFAVPSAWNTLHSSVPLAVSCSACEASLLGAFFSPFGRIACPRYPCAPPSRVCRYPGTCAAFQHWAPWGPEPCLSPRISAGLTPNNRLLLNMCEWVSG